MALAGYFVVKLMPQGVGFFDALQVGGKLGKMNVITTGASENGFDWKDRYNIWSGVIGGFFLALSYFGTDQSQVGRYLTAQNNTESRLGLLLNGLVKIPMQFFILLIGVLVFAFYQFNAVPLSFNNGLINDVKSSVYKDSAQWIQAKFDSLNSEKKKEAAAFVLALKQDQKESAEIISANLKSINQQSDGYRKQFMTWGGKVSAKDKNDTNYIFLSFVKEYLPAGLKGLLIAIIFLAAWGSIAAALNSLAASTVVDFHQQLRKVLPQREFQISQWYTLGWGVFCIVIAQFANNLGNSLIEAVNVLGSLFYGVILGIFLLAFYVKKVKGTAAFWSAVVMECFIVLLFFNENIPGMGFLPDISFLWMNAIGAIGVVLVGWMLQAIFFNAIKTNNES